MKGSIQAALNLLLDLIFMIWETFFKKKDGTQVKKYGGPYGLA